MEPTGKTRLVGVIGQPITHTLSPPMHQAAIAKLGIDWAYVAMPVRPEALGEAIAGARALGFAGLNVTIPHKEAVMRHLDRIDPAARAIGAVNTVHFTEDGGAIGYNTDIYGYTRTLAVEGGFSFAGATVVQIGTGGAGRALAAGAAEAGAARLRLFDIDRGRMEHLAGDLRAHYPKLAIELLERLDPSVTEGAGLVANATPLGMKPGDPMPLPAECLHEGLTVFDAVYVPARTPLLEAARQCGARAVGGLGMLARQGARSLSIWTRGIVEAEPDEGLMIEVLRKRLGV